MSLTILDPVCGMPVTEATGVSLDDGRLRVWFCKGSSAPNAEVLRRALEHLVYAPLGVECAKQVAQASSDPRFGKIVVDRNTEARASVVSCELHSHPISPDHEEPWPTNGFPHFVTGRFSTRDDLVEEHPHSKDGACQTNVGADRPTLGFIQFDLHAPAAHHP